MEANEFNALLQHLKVRFEELAFDNKLQLDMSDMPSQGLTNDQRALLERLESINDNLSTYDPACEGCHGCWQADIQHAISDITKFMNGDLHDVAQVGMVLYRSKDGSHSIGIQVTLHNKQPTIISATSSLTRAIAASPEFQKQYDSLYDIELPKNLEGYSPQNHALQEYSLFQEEVQPHSHG